MEKNKIKIQIHDYDENGIYRIVDEREVTAFELFRLEILARESVKVDWSALPEEARHIVYYAKMLSRRGEFCFVGIYMKGQAYTDADFERIFWGEDIYRVGAYHKRA